MSELSASHLIEEKKQSLQSSKSSRNSNNLDNYVKIKTVGKGAFGTAVLHKRLSDSQEVVLKEVNISDLSSSERVMALNEVDVLSVLHHPNIISYLGSFESDGLLIIEMEYANGGTLAQHIANANRPLPELEILSIFKQIVAAIQYMHEHNILHRDLKTGNIFLTKDKMVKVGDFGISKVMNTKSAAHTVLGTPYYISPEMCEGKEYDEKSDIWALGCILYELACREKTFQGSNLPALVNKIMKGTYEPLPSIYSSGLKILVSDLLQKDPLMRPPASIIFTRVEKLYEKIKIQKNNNTEENYRSLNKRSVLYQLSGHGPSFQLIPMKLPPKSMIISVAAGSTHTIALTSDMLVYTWGEGRKGQLGHEGPPNWQEEPRIVDNLVSQSISSIGAGNGFSAFISDSGSVFTRGEGTSGALGHGDWNDVHIPKHVEKLSNMFVTNLSCGDNHMACITRDEKIYIWGALASGQNVCEPQRLEIPKIYKARHVSCGPGVTGVVTEEGELLVYGSNHQNRLGLNVKMFGYQKEVPKAEQLTLVKPLKKWKIDKVSFGQNHTAVVTEKGEVVTMGSNNDSQLGHNGYGPNKAKFIADRIVTMAECGPTYTVVGTIENAIYFWGTRFTQSCEKVGNSALNVSTIETFLATKPEEVLVLYASKKSISEGISVTLNSIHPLWHSILLVINTTAPYENKKITAFEKEKNNINEDFDTLGPVPDWIKAELAQATHEWPGTFQIQPSK